MSKTHHISRESWLLEAATHLETELFKPNGYTFPPKWSVSVGWPKVSKRSGGDVLGQCFGKTWSEDGTFHIFITPTIVKPVEVLAVLVHELIHAAVGLACKHRGAFAEAHTKLGLVGPKTTCTPGPALSATLESLGQDLGTYPHSRMVNLTTRKKIVAGKTDRIVLRSTNDESYYVYTSRALIEEHGYPVDPWGDEFVPAREAAAIAASRAEAATDEE